MMLLLWLGRCTMDSVNISNSLCTRSDDMDEVDSTLPARVMTRRLSDLATMHLVHGDILGPSPKSHLL